MFKVGDIVERINNDYGFYTVGKSYEVLKINPKHILIECDDDSTVWSNLEGWKLSTKTKEDTKESNNKILTLPTDSEARKQIPAFSGCVKYFPAAIAGVARISKIGNDKHNPGEELNHDRNKSLDHADCILRHLMDTADLIAKLEREENTDPEQILTEVSSLAWRALAYSQTLHEKYDGAPLAPGAKLNKKD